MSGYFLLSLCSFPETFLQNAAPSLPTFLWFWSENRADRLVENLLEPTLRQCRTFHIFDGPYLSKKWKLREPRTKFKFWTKENCELWRNFCFFYLQTLFANFCPCSRFMALNPCSAKRVRVSLSSRKSIFVPTRIIGASGQWCFISGYHLLVTFSKEDGLVTEKQMRNTSVCGYDKGRSLS